MNGLRQQKGSNYIAIPQNSTEICPINGSTTVRMTVAIYFITFGIR